MSPNGNIIFIYYIYMGNAASATSNNNSEFATEIDRIASKYILSQNLDDMNKLADKKQCDNLVILTAKIINNNLSSLEQKKLAERIKPTELPPSKKEPAPPAAKDKDIKKDLKNPEKKQDGGAEPEAEPEPEPLDCVKIAKFYVKIAHLYAAIMKTVNPVIISTDETGKTQKYDLMTKKNMPNENDIKSIQHNNLCTNRINALIQESDFNRNDPNNTVLTITPRFCNINYNTATKKPRKFFEEKEGSSSISKPFTGGKQNHPFTGGKIKDDDDDDDDDEKNKKKKLEKDKNDKDKNGKDKKEDEDDDDGKKKNDKDKDKKNKKNEDEDDDNDDDRNKDKKRENKGKKNDNDDEDNGNIKKPPKEEIKEKPIVPVKDKALIENNSEVGIPELMKLYYDVYDEKKKEFTSMSEKMRIIYEQDVDIFYKAFTGKENDEKDENGKKKIKSFGQIPLREFNKSDGCKPDGIYTKSYEGSFKKEFGVENLFEKYATHVNRMMFTMNTNQNSLLTILKELFIFRPKVIPLQTPVAAEPEPEPEPKPEPEPVPVVPALPAAAPAAAEPKKDDLKPPPPGKKEDDLKPPPPGKKEDDLKPPPPGKKDDDLKPPPPGKKDDDLKPPLPGKKEDDNESPLKKEDENGSPLKKEDDNGPPRIKKGTATKGGATKGGASPTPEEEEEVIINPKLDDELLQSLINTARQIIVKLYITCEQDFLEGIHIFEAIVAVQLAKTNASQILILNNLTMDYLEEHQANI